MANQPAGYEGQQGQSFMDTALPLASSLGMVIGAINPRIGAGIYPGLNLMNTMSNQGNLQAYREERRKLAEQAHQDLEAQRAERAQEREDTRTYTRGRDAVTDAQRQQERGFFRDLGGIMGGTDQGDLMSVRTRLMDAATRAETAGQREAAKSSLAEIDQLIDRRQTATGAIAGLEKPGGFTDRLTTKPSGEPLVGDLNGVPIEIPASLRPSGGSQVLMGSFPTPPTLDPETLKYLEYVQQGGKPSLEVAEKQFKLPIQKMAGGEELLGARAKTEMERTKNEATTADIKRGGVSAAIATGQMSPQPFYPPGAGGAPGTQMLYDRIDLALKAKNYTPGSPAYNLAFLDALKLIPVTEGGGMIGAGSALGPGGGRAPASPSQGDLGGGVPGSPQGGGGGGINFMGPPKPVSGETAQMVSSAAVAREAGQRLKKVAGDAVVEGYQGPFDQWRSTIQRYTPNALAGEIPTKVVKFEQDVALLGNHITRMRAGLNQTANEVERVNRELPKTNSRGRVFQDELDQTLVNITQMEDQLRTLALRGDRRALRVAQDLGIIDKDVTPGKAGGPVTVPTRSGTSGQEVRYERDPKTGKFQRVGP